MEKWREREERDVRKTKVGHSRARRMEARMCEMGEEVKSDVTPGRRRVWQGRVAPAVASEREAHFEQRVEREGEGGHLQLLRQEEARLEPL